MGRKYKENIGEIVIRHDECFWILPVTYLFTKDPQINIYSPWFSFIDEKWRFFMYPVSGADAHSFLYLWRKFRRNLLDHKYTVQIKVKTIDGKDVFSYEGDINRDYGFRVTNFMSVSSFREMKLCQDGLTKIFFSIKEKAVEIDPLCTPIEKINEDDINRRTEMVSEDEVSSDEENDEKRNVLSKDRGIRILLDNLKQAFIDGRMSDAVAKVDDREFKVHKFILVARSPVFASMFEHDMAEKKDNTVDIPDCTAESFEAFLHYLYSGSVDTLSINNVYNVYYAADKYRVDDLKKRCLKFMINNISIETFCDVISLALRHGESKLQKSATDFFSQNIKKIIKTVQWQKYMDENSTHANELLIKALNA